MSNRYVLSSAVVTLPGVYEYRLITPEEARHWLEAGPYFSTVGYLETALALESVTGILVEVNPVVIKMVAGEEALVFRLAPPRGAQRPDDRIKGRLTPAFVRKWCEVGILKKLRD